MWVLLLANTIKGCYILLVFQKNQHCSKKMKNPKILKKCKLYFLEIDDFMKIILHIFSKFWPTMKKRAPPDQNWAILNKFIDTIRESQGMKTQKQQKVATQNQYQGPSGPKWSLLSFVSVVAFNCRALEMLAAPQCKSFRNLFS